MMIPNLWIALASPFITTILGFMLSKVFQNKPKLIAYYGYISEHKVKAPTQENINNKIRVHTHAIVIRNNGNLPAKNVRASHSFLPDYYISENIKYEVCKLEEKGGEIIFPLLLPKEFVVISYLYFPPCTYKDIRTSIKSDEGLAKIVDVIPTVKLSFIQKALAYSLLFLGSSTLVYLIGISILYLIQHIK